MVEADSPDEAIEFFMEEQFAACKTRKVNGDKLEKTIRVWLEADGLLTIDVEEPAPGSVCDVPPLPAVPRPRMPTTIGGLGRRPGQAEPVKPSVKPQRQTLGEYQRELARNIALGVETEEEQVLRLSRETREREDLQLTPHEQQQKKKTPRRKRTTEEMQDGPILGVPDDDRLPSGPFLGPIE
jgi:hypothetical protein